MVGMLTRASLGTALSVAASLPLLVACGTENPAAPTTSRATTPEASESAAIELQCDADDGVYSANWDAMVGAPGAPTMGAAIRDILPSSMSSRVSAIPDHPPPASVAADADGFFQAGANGDLTTVALRHEGRISALFGLRRTDSGGWLAELVEICNELTEPADP
jgi:hypothetical protein